MGWNASLENGTCFVVSYHCIQNFSNALGGLVFDNVIAHPGKWDRYIFLAQGPCNQNIKLAIIIADDGRLIKQTGWPGKGVDCSYNQNKYQPLKNHKSDNQEIKVQVKRTFKSCSFLSTNEQKNRLCKKFSSTPNTSVQQVPKHSTSKSMSPYSVAPSFSTHRLRSTKWHSFNSYTSPSGLLSRMHRLMFL